jgi:hypothetical protein
MYIYKKHVSSRPSKLRKITHQKERTSQIAYKFGEKIDNIFIYDHFISLIFSSIFQKSIN